MRQFEDFHSAYMSTLCELLHKPEFETSPRGIKTKEILNYSFSVKDPETDVEWVKTGMPERQAAVDKYWTKELAWYLSGSLRVEDTPAKFWHTLANDNGMVTSNYGFLALYEDKYEDRIGFRLSPVERVVKLLTADSDSRQAVIHYGESRHFWEGNKDTPCCVNNQFFIREGKLYMIVNMRSNDVWRGLTYDWKWFSWLMKEVQSQYNKTGKVVGLGSLFYNAGSMHLYESEFETAKRVLNY